ncbi:MAG: hypothetical protein AAFN50_07465 [Pseudomonadota bacterium]
MFDDPGWHGDPRQRLRVCVAFAAVVVAILLTQLRIPETPVLAPIGELLVNIVRDDPEPIPPVVEPLVEPLPEVVEPASQPVTQSSEVARPLHEQRSWTDWDEVIRDTVAELGAAEPEPSYSVNPNMDRKRAEAAVKFRPSEAPVERPIWENVEKDLLGRSVLRSGDCYKVIDDPNVGSREAFETFGQYIAICAFYKKPPRELPWVAEINARRAGPSRYARPSVE